MLAARVSFVLLGLPADTYNLLVRQPSPLDATFRLVDVPAGETVRVAIALR